jgi:hypothetical protein
MKTTRQRLTEARTRTAKMAENYPTSAHYCDWRNNVSRPFKKAAPAGRWSTQHDSRDSSRPYYLDSLDAMGWRETGDAADILRAAGGWRSAEQCNWYADNEQNAVIKSAVLQLPARDGRARYIPATYCTDWDGATCHPLDWYDEKEDAARAAAGYAEAEAEESRDYYARDAAEQDIEAARAEIHRINAEALALAREIKQQGRAFSPAICGALRDRLTDYLSDRRQQFQIIAAREADYWSAVQW